ncbi:hypothetical protein J6590_103827, partial [Homalodisca vitripennis]
GTIPVIDNKSVAELRILIKHAPMRGMKFLQINFNGMHIRGLCAGIIHACC